MSPKPGRRAVVAVKCTPSPDEVADLAFSHQLRADELGLDLDLRAVSLGIHGSDELALGLVVDLARSGALGETAAVTVNPLDAGPVARRVFDMGIDDCLVVRSDTPYDELGVARLLAAAARNLDADLVVLGDTSSDTARGVTGGFAAALLDWPCVAGVNRIELDGNDLTAWRRGSDGASERVTTSLPAVVTVCDRVRRELRPRALDVVAARERQPRELRADELLGPYVTPERAVSRAAVEVDTDARSCTFIDGRTPDEVASELYEVLLSVGVETEEVR